MGLKVEAGSWTPAKHLITATSTLRFFFVPHFSMYKLQMTIFRPPKSSLVSRNCMYTLKDQSLILLHLHSISKIYPFGAMQSQVLDGFWTMFFYDSPKKSHQGIQRPSEWNWCWGVRWLWSRMMVSTLILAACGALFFACRSFAETFSPNAEWCQDLPAMNQLVGW